MISSIVPITKEDDPVAADVSKIFELVGRFCYFESYYPIVTSLLKVQIKILIFYNWESCKYEK